MIGGYRILWNLHLPVCQDQMVPSPSVSFSVQPRKAVRLVNRSSPNSAAKGIGDFLPVGSGVLGRREINSGGNIETNPPYTSKKTGKHYPLGRILTGQHFKEKHSEAMMKFFQGQQLQGPLVIEAGWLAVGHVDEFTSFLPADNEL